MRRRTRPDPLQPVPAPAWLVVRNQCSQVIDSRRLEPSADLRSILVAAHAERIASGWCADDIGDRIGFFFCKRESERLLVSIEFRPPQSPGARW
jgi:hypothetical protein